LHHLAHVPEAKAAPQLLILAEPLLREGLIRLLEPQHRIATQPEQLQGRLGLVIWSCSADLPLANLQGELEQLQERWQPAPILLLLPGQTPYTSEDLLRLPCDGVLQQAEPEEIPAAVATLLNPVNVARLHQWCTVRRFLPFVFPSFRPHYFCLLSWGSTCFGVRSLWC